MKKFRWVLLVLLLATLACSTLTGGGNNNAATNIRDNSAANSTNNNSANDDADNNTGMEADDDTDVEEDTSSLSVASDLSSDSSCYSPFYPVNQERVWTYEADYPGQPTVQYTIAITEVNDETITSQMDFTEFSSTVVWYCGLDGLFSSDFAQFNIAELPEDFVDIETISYDGLTLPKENLWEVGYSWDSSYEIKINMAIEEVALESTATGTFTSTIVAIEAVTVPAGTFPQAYRVDMIGEITMETMGVSIPAPVNSSTWYVKDVGMVKTVSTDESGTSTTVLLSID
jgi:hypothetical protein